MKEFKPTSLVDNQTQIHYMLEELGESDFVSVTVRVEVYEDETLLGEMHLNGWVDQGSVYFQHPEMAEVAAALAPAEVVPEATPEPVTTAQKPVRKPRTN